MGNNSDKLPWSTPGRRLGDNVNYDEYGYHAIRIGDIVTCRGRLSLVTGGRDGRVRVVELNPKLLSGHLPPMKRKSQLQDRRAIRLIANCFTLRQWSGYIPALVVLYERLIKNWPDYTQLSQFIKEHNHDNYRDFVQWGEKFDQTTGWDHATAAGKLCQLIDETLSREFGGVHKY